MLEEETSCQMKKFIARGRNLLSEEYISCQKKKYFLREEIFYQRKHLMPQKEMSCCRIQFLVKGFIFSLINRKTQMRQKRMNFD